MPTLADILKAEADLASAFVIVLEEEQEVLKTGNPDALPSLAERKSTLAGQLNPQSAARNRLLASEGLPGDRPGIEGWLSKHPKDGAVRQEWNRLLEVTRRAHELNRVNGELIRLRQQHNSEALDALLPGLRQDLYSPEGQTAPVTGRRIIDSA